MFNADGFNQFFKNLKEVNLATKITHSATTFDGLW